MISRCGSQRHTHTHAHTHARANRQAHTHTSAHADTHSHAHDHAQDKKDKKNWEEDEDDHEESEKGYYRRGWYDEGANGKRIVILVSKKRAVTAHGVQQQQYFVTFSGKQGVRSGNTRHEAEWALLNELESMEGWTEEVKAFQDRELQKTKTPRMRIGGSYSLQPRTPPPAPHCEERSSS